MCIAGGQALARYSVGVLNEVVTFVTGSSPTRPLLRLLGTQ
jgi:hypothetical protein